MLGKEYVPYNGLQLARLLGMNSVGKMLLGFLLHLYKRDMGEGLPAVGDNVGWTTPIIIVFSGTALTGRKSTNTLTIYLESIFLLLWVQFIWEILNLMDGEITTKIVSNSPGWKQKSYHKKMAQTSSTHYR